jgi:hypothetical protein
MKFVDLSTIAMSDALCMVDAWGNTKSGWACPSQPQVQEKWLAAVVEVGEGPVEIRGLGFRGTGEFFGSICFCAACLYGYGMTGGILEQIAREGKDPGHPSVNLMLIWRRSVQWGLLKQMKEASPGPLWLRTAAELRHTGKESSLTFFEAKGLVAACTVVVRDEQERARLKALDRPMPVYEVRGNEYVPLE